jgi:hypothetical protein
VEPLTSDTLIDGPTLDWRQSPGNNQVLTVMADEEERQREHQTRAAEARRKMAQLRARPNSEKSVIEQFNATNDVEQVLAACGRTDQKTKKKIAEMAAGMVARCEESVQMYLAKALLEATSTLGLEWPEAEESAEDPDLWSSSEPDPLWAPHNHD